MRKSRASAFDLEFACERMLEMLGGAPGGSYGHTLNSVAGELTYKVYDGWVAMRFEDVVRAKKEIGMGTLNPHSGKWNWHFGEKGRSIAEVTELAETISRYLDMSAEPLYFFYGKSVESAWKISPKEPTCIRIVYIEGSDGAFGSGDLRSAYFRAGSSHDPVANMFILGLKKDSDSGGRCLEPDRCGLEGGPNPHTLLRVYAMPLSSVQPERLDARDFPEFRRELFESALLERMKAPRDVDLSKPAESVSRPRMVG